MNQSVFRLFYVVFIAVLLALGAVAQTGKGTLTGKATDSSGGVLHGAHVEVHPGGGTAVTNDRGEFTIAGLEPGKYSVTISYEGLASVTSEVTVASGQNTIEDPVLAPASPSEVILVTAERAHGEAEAINRQKTSDNILQVLPSEVITSLPNANIADAVGRLPSVTLERDEGEGKYVQIRGMEPRLNNVTIDGFNVPSPEGNVRQVKLDVVPADLVESVEINKTLSSNQDAEGIGGSVNLRTKTAGDDPTITLNGLGGYTPIIGGRASDEFSGTMGQRFGKEKQFGALFGATYDYNGRGIDDIEPSPNAVQNGNVISPTYDSMDLREYQYYRTRYGFAGSTDYKFKNGSMIWVRGLYSDFKDYGNKWVYTLNNGDAPKYSTSDRRPNYEIGSVEANGSHYIGGFSLNWAASVGRARQTDAAGNPGTKFKATGPLKGITWCVYDPAATITIYRPQFTPACTAPGSPIYDPNNYVMNTYDTSTGKTAQVNLVGGADLGKAYKWGSHQGLFQFGALVRNVHKYQDAYQPEWDPTRKLYMTQFLGTFTNPNYYMGSYQLGPVTDYNRINSFFNANPNDFTLDVSATHLNSDPNNFDAIELVSAGYLMNTLDFGKWRLVAGVRFEGTNLNLLGNLVVTDSNGNWASTTPLKTSSSYLNVLPAASLRYSLPGDSDIRAVYGRGIARPNLYDMVPYFQLDDQGQTISIGNPKLKPEYANNYDLLYEKYLKPFGLIQAGFFYKQLYEPIYQVNNLLTSGPYAGYTEMQNINGSTAWLTGVEATYQQHLGFLPGPLAGLGISANYSWTASQASGVPGRSDTPRLERQAPNTWNISPTYDRGRVSIRVGLSYNGESIYSYQYQNGVPFGLTGPFGDQYFYPHLQLDAQGSVRIYKGLFAVASGLNLTNEVFGFYNGSPQYVVQREYYSPTFSGGLRWTFVREK